MNAQSIKRYRDLIRRFRSVRVLVAGDLIADEFVYGQIDRVSREAPVLILSHRSTEIVPGGAANAANNAAALGADVRLVGLVGQDAAGHGLVRALEDRLRLDGLVRGALYATPVKTRILAGGPHSAKQQVIRVDRAGGVITPPLRRRVETALAAAIPRADVVIISDYGTGLITPVLWARALAASRTRRVPYVLVDSRHALLAFPGVTAATPNESEVEALLKTHIDDDLEVLEEAGRKLLALLDVRALLVTRGSRGMALFEPGKRTEHIEIVGSDEVADVTGAGDTVIATFALALGAKASFSEAAHLANHAGGIVVMKRGTATVSRDELEASVAAAGAKR